MKLRALSSLSSLGLLEEAIFSFPILQGALFSTSHFFPFLFSLCLLKICTRTWEMKSIEWKMTSIYFSRAASQWSLIYTGINSSRQIIDEPVINVTKKILPWLRACKLQIFLILRELFISDSRRKELIRFRNLLCVYCDHKKYDNDVFRLIKIFQVEIRANISWQRCKYSN